MIAAAWVVQPLPFRLTTGETARKPLPATTPGGLAVFDYDGDGLLDIFFTNGGGLPAGPKAPNKLLRNLGNWNFQDVTAKVGLDGRYYDIGVAVGDYDNDGRPDLLVSGLQGVSLYRNQPDGTFADVTAKAGINNQGRWSVGAVWLDIDNDANLDLFIVNYVRWDPKSERECLVSGKPDFCHPRHYAPLANAVFRNNGDGSFSDISVASGIAQHQGKGMAAVAADFDGDGLVDIFVTNDRTFAFLFHNLGGGKFEEKAFDWGVAVPFDGKTVSGMGVDAQDWDNDGRIDLVYSALRDETFPLYRFIRGGFEEATHSSRVAVLSRPMSGWGVAFADLDNDGWKDIAAATSDALSPTGGKGRAAMERAAWFHNDGNGKFSAGTGWDVEPDMYRGIVAADLNNDGCLDIVLTALQSTARLMRNPCNAGPNWVKVDVKTTGARVRAGNQWLHVSTAVGYASSYAGPLHFGLGNTPEVEIEVIWPDGHRKTITTPARRTARVQP
jgi:enediyne biosynthesis protein E4